MTTTACGNPNCRHRHKRRLRPLVISIIPTSSASCADANSPNTIGGSSRHEKITRMFTTHPSLSAHFEPPIYSPGVPSRELRNRLKLLEYANRAGLLPELEWKLICRAINEQLLNDAGDNREKREQEVVGNELTSKEMQQLDVRTEFEDLRRLSQQFQNGETQTVVDPFIYLATTSRIVEPLTSSCDDVETNTLYKNKKLKKKEFETKSLVPISHRRRGSAEDIALPYSMELWRKAKSLNRDRSVFGCTLAHLIAMKTLIGDGYDKSDDLSSHQDAEFDFILEDNVRAFVGLDDNMTSSCECASRIWDIIEASNKANDKPHLRYYGWLGSTPNLKWLYNNHIPRKAFPDTAGEGSYCAIFPFPTSNDFLLDSIGSNSNISVRLTSKKGTDSECHPEELPKHPSFSTPGGTAIWGMFAYTISPSAYFSLLEQLRNDVGMLMWKGKRMRAYQAKAIDKIIPRTVRETFSEMSIHLSEKVAFVRCPMLGSLLHKQWEQGFCESTELQHALSNHEEGCDAWDNVWLEEEERLLVEYRKKNGKWIRKEEMQDKTLSNSKCTASGRSRSKSPVYNIAMLSLMSMLLLVNMFASAFMTSTLKTQKSGTLHRPAKSKTENERERAMLGHVPIISRTLSIAEDMNVTVWEMEKPSDIIQEWWSLGESERASRVGDPFGVVVWPGSILASKELMKQRQAVSNATVLILGAGPGVEAFAAALLGAKKVIATDINPLTLQLLAYGAERMEGIDNVVEAKHFDLFSNDQLPSCDILVAADTLYNEDLAKQVGHRLNEAIVRSFETGHSPTKVIVTDSQQFWGTDFLAEKKMKELNAIFQDGKWEPLHWEFETLTNVCGSGVLVDEDQTYDVDVRIISWGWDKN